MAFDESLPQINRERAGHGRASFRGANPACAREG
jgi:hypothetical protein